MYKISSSCIIRSANVEFFLYAKSTSKIDLTIENDETIIESLLFSSFRSFQILLNLLKSLLNFVSEYFSITDRRLKNDEF